jgi:hypothetical protein
LDVARTRFATLNNNFRNILKVFRNIERAPRPGRRLIEVLIQILRLTIRPTLAPGTDVRALAVHQDPSLIEKERNNKRLSVLRRALEGSVWPK